MNTKRLFVTALQVLLSTLSAMALPAHAQSAETCGSLHSSYGPFDYRVEANGLLKIVDEYHFTPEVEALLRGKSSSIGADIDYVLRTSPNHHRALSALQRLAERQKTTQVQGMHYSVDCYFERALRFQRDDTVARMILVLHLIATNRSDQAPKHLEFVANLAGDNAFTHYNLGLLYLQIKDYENARKQAYLSEELGLKRPDLREQLARAGQWIEPPAKPAEAESSSSPSSAPLRTPEPVSNTGS